MRFKVETINVHGNESHRIDDNSGIYRGTVYVDGLQSPAKTVTVTAYGNYSALTAAEKEAIRPILKQWADDRLSWTNKPIRILLP